MRKLLAVGDIRELLGELALRMSAAGIQGGIRVVGGSAIALMNPLRRATQDIDAVLVPAGPIVLIASDIALERGLQPDWLNDAVKAYIPLVGTEDWIEILREGDAVVSIGSSEMLLAMKLLSNRGRRDAEDIEYLLGECGISTVEEAQAVYERYHAQEVISDSAVARIRHWLDRR